MPEPPFSGVAVALVTLFDESAEVDAAATAAHAARVVAAGVTAVVVAGSTAEAPALAPEERVGLVAAVREATEAVVPVVAGTGASSTRQAVSLTRQAVEAGADGVLVLSPPRVDDPSAYYRAVADAAGGTPVLAYHFPAVSPPGVPVEALASLQIAGIKDSSGDADRLLRTVTSYDGAVYVGSSALVLQAGAIGCAGAILAAANLEPELSVAAFAGDGDAQRRLHDAHVAVRTRFPHGLKTAMAAKFGTSTVTRMG